LYQTDQPDIRLLAMFKFLSLLFFVGLNFQSHAAVPESDRICGKWISSDKKLIVEVYKDQGKFKAKIVWFNDDPSKPMEEWRDKHNPDPALRNRRIVGLEILSGLKYDTDSHTWEGGKIYDAQHGKQWDAAGYIDKDGSLKVKGYWHIKIIGRTMVFKRV
jgi:uncharacterized protein (DUF2147 family)